MKKGKTTIAVDTGLLKEIMRFSDEKTEKEVVLLALREHLRILKRRKLASLQGKINWEGDLYQMRVGRYLQ